MDVGRWTLAGMTSRDDVTSWVKSGRVARPRLAVQPIATRRCRNLKRLPGRENSKLQKRDHTAKGETTNFDRPLQFFCISFL